MTESRLHRPYFRNGADHREGQDVGFADIVRTFGFRTVSIGKWVSKQEQQLAANLFFDAFCDLLTILAVPEQVISLNGTLSLAFGTGGNKHSSAHYESTSRTLALAKNAGGGALAHEWFHAFDHYICRKLFADASPHDFASDCWLKGRKLIPHPLNQRLCQYFQICFLQNGQGSEYLKRAVAIDKKLNIFYYAQPQELAARAFEAMIQDHSLKNAFLVQGTKQSREAEIGLYPVQPLRHQLAQQLAEYFHLLGLALDSKP
ncbi:CLCA_X family protein [Bowmanella denitrificans]|uniref:CLCA_X family protein n=1 Tax=Bowmanella denitrificans TaxID=366582 RepID=UPI000C9A4676|nr:CLCA_X family protein [Bowmanella denitrificans]